MGSLPFTSLVKKEGSRGLTVKRVFISKNCAVGKEEEETRASTLSAGVLGEARVKLSLWISASEMG